MHHHHPCLVKPDAKRIVEVNAQSIKRNRQEHFETNTNTSKYVRNGQYLRKSLPTLYTRQSNSSYHQIYSSYTIQYHHFRDFRSIRHIVVFQAKS